LKATDYGIPQSRQRLFLIGINKEFSHIQLNFPPPKLDLTIKMQDLLEDNVNTQYYLQEKGQVFAVSDKNISKKYTQINGDIALCQKKNQQFNWHGDFIFEYRDIPEKYYLSDKEKAKQIYQELLLNFSGSTYAVDARKRYRELRGDAPTN
jgi:DNA (cytosine-5)-methyltransferase 1